MSQSEFNKRIRSFFYAGNGIRVMFGKHPNFKIQLFFACLAIILGIFFQIQLIEWAILLICIGMVLALETINTAIEYLVDLVSPDFNPIAGKIKDLAAAAVLIFCIFATLIGILLFFPYILQIRFS